MARRDRPAAGDPATPLALPPGHLDGSQVQRRDAVLVAGVNAAAQGHQVLDQVEVALLGRHVQRGQAQELLAVLQRDGLTAPLLLSCAGRGATRWSTFTTPTGSTRASQRASERAPRRAHLRPRRAGAPSSRLSRRRGARCPARRWACLAPGADRRGAPRRAQTQGQARGCRGPRPSTWRCGACFCSCCSSQAMAREVGLPAQALSLQAASAL